MQSYEYHYQRDSDGALLTRTDPLVPLGEWREISIGDYNRSLQRVNNDLAVAKDAAASERDAKRAALAAKLGIDVEDLALLR